MYAPGTVTLYREGYWLGSERFCDSHEMLDAAKALKLKHGAGVLIVRWDSGKVEELTAEYAV